MTLTERLHHYGDQTPDTAAAAFVARNATLVGAVTLGRDSSIFYGSILRADINSIVIGEGTNIQDGTIIHLADEIGVEIGDHTTVGHGAMIHACKIGSGCLVGMRAIILDGAEIGDGSFIAAGALVTPGTKIPPGSMIMGAPGRVTRQLSDDEQAKLRHWAEKYVTVARKHAGSQQPA